MLRALKCWIEAIPILFLFVLLLLPLQSEALSENLYATDLELSSSQYWSIADASQTGLDISGNFSISAWVKFESFSGNAMTVVAKSNSASNSTIAYSFFFYDDANPSPHIRLNSTVGNGSSSGSVQEYFSPTAALDTWYHVGMTYTASSGNVQFYLDGSPLGSPQATGITAINNTSEAFRIGASNNGGSASTFFDGKVDDVRVYQRVLSSSDMSDLYTDPCGFGNGQYIDAWYFENNGNGASSTPNNLTNNNVATFSSDVPYTCGGGGGGSSVDGEFDRIATSSEVFATTLLGITSLTLLIIGVLISVWMVTIFSRI